MIGIIFLQTEHFLTVSYDFVPLPDPVIVYAVILCHADEPWNKSGCCIEPFERVENFQEYLLRKVLGVFKIRCELKDDIKDSLIVFIHKHSPCLGIPGLASLYQLTIAQIQRSVPFDTIKRYLTAHSSLKL